MALPQGPYWSIFDRQAWRNLITGELIQVDELRFGKLQRKFDVRAWRFVRLNYELEIIEGGDSNDGPWHPCPVIPEA